MAPERSTVVTALAAAAAGAAVGVAVASHRRSAAAAIVDVTPRARPQPRSPPTYSVVVFLDGEDVGKNIKLPRAAGWHELVGAVIGAFAGRAAADVRLFRACSKEEVTPGNAVASLAAAAGADDALVVLLATSGGAALSDAALAAPPLGMVPRGPKPATPVCAQHVSQPVPARPRGQWRREGEARGFGRRAGQKAGRAMTAARGRPRHPRPPRPPNPLFPDRLGGYCAPAHARPSPRRAQPGGGGRVR